MIKNKSHFQPSLAGKKQKKRSSSSSYNKQNLSLSHNDSMCMQSQKHHLLLNKQNLKNSSLNNKKQCGIKTKKTKKSLNNQGTAKNIIHKNNVLMPFQHTHNNNQRNNSSSIGIDKKSKKLLLNSSNLPIHNKASQNNKFSSQNINNNHNCDSSSSRYQNQLLSINPTVSNKHKNKLNMVIIQNERQHINYKQINDYISMKQQNKHNFDDFVQQGSKEQKRYKQLNKKIKNLSDFPQFISKSSTIISNSTGNIQFSQYSNDDNEMLKNQQSLNLKRNLNMNKNNVNFNFRKVKYTPTKAATLIQKTWRGYLTRKLLQQYIQSFQPMYEEQLKQIRSNNQSRRDSRHIISSQKKGQQKSSFFDQRSELQECSEIQPVDTQMQNIITSFRNQTQKHKSILHLQESSNYSLNQSNIQKKYDLPVQRGQFFKKTAQAKTDLKHNKQPQIQQTTINKADKQNQSTRLNTQVNSSKRQKVSEFTLKQNPKTQYLENKDNLMNSNNNQQTKKIIKQCKILSETKRTNKNLCLQRSIFSLSIKGSYNASSSRNQNASLSSHIKNLNQTSQNLGKLFHSYNSICFSQLKTMIKQNKINLQQLMERKDSLKDILQNGRQFISNVTQQIAKAFDEMDRITKDGISSQSQRQRQGDQSCEKREEQNLIEQNHQHSKKVQQSIKQNIKPRQDQRKDSSVHDNKINNKYFNCQPSFDDSIQISSSQKKYYNNSSNSNSKNNSNRKSHSRRNPASQFYTIDLPTQQYSIKGKSPIQQDQDGESYDGSYEQRQDQNEDGKYYNQDQNNQFDNEDQQQFDQDQSPILKQNLIASKQYQTHRQSYQILNQFLLNLIEQYSQINTSRQQQSQSPVSQLQYLCQTLKRVTCDSQNKTIIDRCLIQFMVEMMTETFTLKEIYQGFKKMVYEVDGQMAEDNSQQENQKLDDDEKGRNDKNQQHENVMDKNQMKLNRILKRWIQQLQKWQMNIIQQVPSKMQSSSFINTLQNISFHDIRQSINNMTSHNNP